MQDAKNSADVVLRVVRGDLGTKVMTAETEPAFLQVQRFDIRPTPQNIFFSKDYHY